MSCSFCSLRIIFARRRPSLRIPPLHTAATHNTCMSTTLPNLIGLLVHHMPTLSIYDVIMCARYNLHPVIHTSLRCFYNYRHHTPVMHTRLLLPSDPSFPSLIRRQLHLSPLPPAVDCIRSLLFSLIARTATDPGNAASLYFSYCVPSAAASNPKKIFVFKTSRKCVVLLRSRVLLAIALTIQASSRGRGRRRR